MTYNRFLAASFSIVSVALFTRLWPLHMTRRSRAVTLYRCERHFRMRDF